MDESIFLLDENFEITADPIDDYTSFVYVEKWNDHGSFSVTLKASLYSSFDDAKYVYFDNHTFIIEHKEKSDTLVISGRTLSALFDGITIYSTYDRLQGNLETEIRTLVTTYAMSGAQAIEKLALEPLVGYARAIDSVAAKQSLSSFLFSALNLRGFSFKLDYDQTSDEIVFNLLQGIDHSQDTLGDGTALFSTDEGNIENVKLKEDIQDEYNFAYVNNEDETDPKIVEVDLSYGEKIKSLYVSGKSVSSSDDGSGDLYVMVGYGGYIATSINGTTWTQRTSGTTEDLFGIDYQNGTFVACGGNGTILTSADGITWTIQSSGVSVALEGALYYDGAHVVTGNSSNILASYDGITWDLVFTGTRKIVSPLFVKDRFVAVSAGTQYMFAYISENGFDWISVRTDFGDSFISMNALTLSYHKGLLLSAGKVSIDSIEYPIVFISSDVGDTWQANVLYDFSATRFLDMVDGNGVVVAIGQPNIIAVSEDGGYTWSNVTPSGATPDWISVTFDGEKFHAYSATTKHHAYSNDGTSWTVETISISAALVDAVIFGTSGYTSALYQKGVEALQSAAKVESVTGDILPNKTPIYGSDYTIGDIVDIIDDEIGMSAAKRVTAYKHIYEPEQVVAIPILGDDTLNLRNFIKREVQKNVI